MEGFLILFGVLFVVSITLLAYASIQRRGIGSQDIAELTTLHKESKRLLEEAVAWQRDSKRLLEEYVSLHKETNRLLAQWIENAARQPQG